MIVRLKQVFNSKGTSAVEYSMMLAFVGVLSIASLQSVGEGVNSRLTDVFPTSDQFQQINQQHAGESDGASDLQLQGGGSDSTIGTDDSTRQECRTTDDRRYDICPPDAN